MASPAASDVVSARKENAKLAYVWVYGVLCVGVPVTILLNLGLLALRDQHDLFFSVANGFELTSMLFVLTPLIGLIAGGALWFRNREVPPTIPAVAVASASDSMAEDHSAVRELEALKSRVEQLAVTNPAALDRRIVGFTLLGYGYILGLIGIVIAVIFSLYRMDEALFGLSRLLATFGWIFLGIVVSSLWVTFPKPQGRRLTRTGSPALFSALDDIQRSLKAPAPDVVLLTSEVNAAVAEHPRFGLLPVSTRVLYLGLPLLEALTEQESKAILAHELAHLSKRHTRRLVWVVRLATTWSMLVMSLEAQRHFGRRLLLPFFRWYAPRFDVYAQVVSRRDEYESDRIAASVAGPSAAASALMRLSVTDRFVTEVLRPLYRRSVSSPEPPSDAFEVIGNALQKGMEVIQASRWIERTLADRSIDAHDHPSISDRIARLEPAMIAADSLQKLAEVMSVRRGSSGAEALLGPRRLSKLRNEVSADWQQLVLPAWRQLHTDALIWRHGESDGGDELEVLRARARWSTSCEPRKVALPIVREMLRRSPRDPEAHIWMGELLLAGEDPEQWREGREILERVLDLDSSLAMHAARVLEQEYARLGSRADIVRVQSRVRWLERRLIAGLYERTKLRARDTFDAYPVPQPVRDRIQKVCALQEGLSEAFLVRKQRKFLQDQPLVVLAILLNAPWYKPVSSTAPMTAIESLHERLVVHEAADILVLAVEPGSALSRKLRRTPGALVFSRRKETRP